MKALSFAVLGGASNLGTRRIGQRGRHYRLERKGGAAYGPQDGQYTVQNSLKPLH